MAALAVLLADDTPEDEEEEEGGGRWGWTRARSWEREDQVGDTLGHPAVTPDELLSLKK